MRLAILFLTISVTVLAQTRAGGAGTVPPGANMPPGAPGASGQQQEPPPIADCAISGRVLSVTGSPLNKATLTLIQVFTGPATGARRPASYTTSSDPEGKFVMTELPPGPYHLRAERNGFATANYGARGAMRSGTTRSHWHKNKVSLALRSSLRHTPSSPGVWWTPTASRSLAPQ